MNRYSYVLNNPVNITDPSGHAPCFEDDNGNLRCGYGDPDNYPVFDNGGGSDNGGGGYDDGGGGDNGGGTPTQPWWMDKELRMQNLQDAAGWQGSEGGSGFQDFLDGTYNVLDAALGLSDIKNSWNTLFDPSKDWLDRTEAFATLGINVAMDVSMVIGVGELARGGRVSCCKRRYLPR